MKDKITVITICFNAVDFIDYSIKSVIEQKDDNFEHVVIDGGSTDGTLEILKKYNHLRYISEVDNGQSDAMNKGFDLAIGDIIVYLNADDFFLPNSFRDIRKAFKNTDVEIVVGNLLIKENERERISDSEFTYRKIIHPMYYGFPYNPVCYFYRRHIQEKVGLFPIYEHYVMDYWFIIRAFKGAKVMKLDSVLGCFNIHENCKTNSVTDSRIKFLNTIKEFNNSQNICYKSLYFFDEIMLKLFKSLRII